MKLPELSRRRFLAGAAATAALAALPRRADAFSMAGTETSTYWNGYMDGAVRAGARAAAEVLALL